jgi:hypothetical protein
MSPVATSKSARRSEAGMESPTPRAAQERGECDREPLHRVEGAKQNCFHHFVSSSKGLEDFDLGFVAVHALIPLLRPGQFKLALVSPKNDASFHNAVRLTARARPIQR